MICGLQPHCHFMDCLITSLLKGPLCSAFVTHRFLHPSQQQIVTGPVQLIRTLVVVALKTARRLSCDSLGVLSLEA
jgi:hypothetical protein